MQRLDAKDGTPLHIKVIRSHARRVQRVKSALHKTLHAEAKALADELLAKRRGHEDAENAETDAAADAESAELELEDAIRDLDADLEKYDRKHPGENLRIAVFPNGFGEVIDPDGEAQLDTLPRLRVRMEKLNGIKELADSAQAVDGAEANFRDSLSNAQAAGETERAAFAAEIETRTKIRQQIESAHGRLRDFYKARPAIAERFFLKLGRREGKADAKAKPASPAPAAGPTGPTGPTDK